jgi:glycosyltransferase involved in cell wall biosynthesis
MTRSFRVLYLAPSSPDSRHLSRYSFLDEEIRALAHAGVEAFVLGQTGGKDQDDGQLHIRSVPPDTFARQWQVTRFILDHSDQIPVRNLAEIRHCYGAARIESFAADLVHKENIDLIHSYFGWPRGFGGLLTRCATGKPLVAGLRGNDVNMSRSLNYGARSKPAFDRALRRLLQHADATISVSEFVRNQAASLGARPEASRVIRKGVRLDLFRPSPEKEKLRRELGIGGEPLILAVANLIPIKGINHVLEALGALHQSRRFSVLVCGEGKELNSLMTLAARVGLGDRARFVGRVSRDEIPKYFGAADLFVHGSLIEASGNALLEAMAAGVPVVCTNAGGPAEYVADGVSGFVVPVAEPKVMAERIRLLLDDPELRLRLGCQARHRAEAHFGYDEMIRQTIATYESIGSTSNSQG